jgi:hypothetical protein
MTTPGYGYILYTPGYYGYYQVDYPHSQRTNTNNSYVPISLNEIVQRNCYVPIHLTEKANTVITGEQNYYTPVSLTETVKTANSLYNQEYYYSGDSIFNNQNLYTSPFKGKNEHCHKKKSKQNTSTKSQPQYQSVKLNTIQESQNE